MNAGIYDDVAASVKYILKEHHQEWDIILEKDMLLRDDIGMDSIDLVILQIEIEDKFKIRFDPLNDDFQNIFYSIGTLCRYVEMKLGKNNDKKHT